MTDDAPRGRGRPFKDPAQRFFHWSLVREGVERGLSVRAAAASVAHEGCSAPLLRRNYLWVERARKDPCIAARLDDILEWCRRAEDHRGFYDVRNWRDWRKHRR
jgi:hypothetical protein